MCVCIRVSGDNVELQAADSGSGGPAGQGSAGHEEEGVRGRKVERVRGQSSTRGEH